jgi:hypothetical protein
MGNDAPTYTVCRLRQRVIVRERRWRTIATLMCIVVVSARAPLSALELRVTQMRVAGTRISAAFDVRDLLRDSFLKLLQDGRAVFLQLEAELWEDRRVFDRIVIAVPPVTWRIDREPAGGGVLLLDQSGGSVRHGDLRQPLALTIDIGPASRVEEDATYYLHATMTAATVDERDIDRAGEAIFGDEQSASGLAGLGRFVFRTLLRMGKYFESATAEVTSRRVSGREIRTAAI